MAVNMQFKAWEGMGEVLKRTAFRVCEYEKYLLLSGAKGLSFTVGQC
jgi:hypothetical protein